MARVRVFCATSLDGFLAGPGDDLSFLPPPVEGEDGGFGAFLGEVGALLMGRRTFDVVAGFDGPWPYGERPVLVATHRPLVAPPGRSVPPTVQAVAGPIDALLDRALRVAAGRDVYLDGGVLIRAALEANRIDQLVVTLVPTALGAGLPLFAGLPERRRFRLLRAEPILGDCVQLTLERA